MKPRRSEHHANDTATRIPAFTVATALAWLGHDDCRACPEQVDARADVWLVVPAPGGRPSGMRARVDFRFIDPPWSHADGDRIAAEISVCTRRDRIQVDQLDDAETLTTSPTPSADLGRHPGRAAAGVSPAAPPSRRRRPAFDAPC